MHATCAQVQQANSDLLDAYARLAAEYDDPEHSTTRSLEALSRQALERARREIPPEAVRSIVELGAGTGALTGALLDAWPQSRVLATDRSPESLAVLRTKYGTVAGRLSVELADVSPDGAGVGEGRPDLVVGGLADPFLDGETFGALVQELAPGARLLFTVPSRTWARRERNRRLGIPLDSTRFRLRDGSIVFADSFAYDRRDARRLLAVPGVKTIALGTEQSTDLWSEPEVCWMLAVCL